MCTHHAGAACCPCCVRCGARCPHARPDNRAVPPPLQASGEGGTARGWAEGAPPQALAGLSAVYAELIQPKFQLKVRWGPGQGAACRR